MVCNEAKNLNGMERFGQHDLSEMLKPSFINVEVN